MVNQNQKKSFSSYRPDHFGWTLAQGIAYITLNRPERKNPLTMASYAELRELFGSLCYATDVNVVVIRGEGGNFCSGGDVHEIIGPLVGMDMPELLEFTRMTGDLILAMRKCPQPIIAAIEGVCAGAGAMLALASDFRYASPTAKTAFLFTRVGLAEEGERWGFYNRIVESAQLAQEVAAVAASLASGPSFAHAMTKNMLHQEWSMTVEQAIEAEAQAQAICMQTNDFERAYRAFVAKQKPVFEGN
jgi:enoyl-CoA hydratase/carnithine racemase